MTTAKRIILTALLALYLPLAGADVEPRPAPKAEHPYADDWTPLFQENLSNAVDKEGVWSFTDGLLEPREDQILWSTRVYESFIIDLEFRLGPGANSGIIVYGTDFLDWVSRSVEIQLLDDHSEDFKDHYRQGMCGAIYGHKAPVETHVVREPGKWNRITVECRGPFITVILNGKKVNHFDMRAWTSSVANPDGSPIPHWLRIPKAELPTYGHIGLQGKHGKAEVSFRNLRLRVLD